jgi:hypothetical protein
MSWKRGRPVAKPGGADRIDGLQPGLSGSKRNSGHVSTSGSTLLSVDVPSMTLDQPHDEMLASPTCR